MTKIECIRELRSQIAEARRADIPVMLSLDAAYVVLEALDPRGDLADAAAAQIQEGLEQIDRLPVSDQDRFENLKGWLRDDLAELDRRGSAFE